MIDDPGFSANLFFPQPNARPCPAGGRDVSIDVEGARLHVRIHVCGRARGVLLLFHGNGETVADWDELAPLVNGMDWDCAVAGYRGYGASTGAPSMRAALRDAVVVARSFEATKPLVVMGRSLGSACAWEVSTRLGRRIAGVLIDSGFVDVDAFVRRRGFEPEHLTVEERTVIDPLPKIARTSAPVVWIHGELDAAIAIREALVGVEASPAADKELVRVRDRGHNDLSASPLHAEAIRRALARWGEGL